MGRYPAKTCVFCFELQRCRVFNSLLTIMLAFACTRNMALTRIGYFSVYKVLYIGVLAYNKKRQVKRSVAEWTFWLNACKQRGLWRSEAAELTNKTRSHALKNSESCPVRAPRHHVVLLTTLQPDCTVQAPDARVTSGYSHYGNRMETDTHFTWTICCISV